MEENTIVVTFINFRTGVQEDLEIPVDISANDLIYALKNAYQLDRSADGSFGRDGYLKCENPIALLRGEKKISDYKLHDGSFILYP